MALGSGISASLGGYCACKCPANDCFCWFYLDDGVCIRKSVKLGEGFATELFFIPVSLLECFFFFYPPTALFSTVASTHPLLQSLYVFFACLHSNIEHIEWETTVSWSSTLTSSVLCFVELTENRKRRREAGMRWSDVWNNNKKMTLSTLKSGVCLRL